MRDGGFPHLAPHLGGLLVRHVMPEVLSKQGTGAISPFLELLRRQRTRGEILHQGAETGAARFSDGGKLVAHLGGNADHDIRHAASIRHVYVDQAALISPIGDERAHAPRGDDEAFLAEGGGGFADGDAGNAELLLKPHFGDQSVHGVLTTGDPPSDLLSDLLPLGPGRIEFEHSRTVRSPCDAGIEAAVIA